MVEFGAAENLGGSFAATGGNNTLSFAIEVLPSDVEVALDLLSDALTCPIFDEATFRTELEAQIANLKEEDDEILDYGFRFSDFLQALRQTALEAFESQEVPFEKLVEELQPERNPAYPPLVQVMFNLHNEPHSRVSLPGLSANAFSLASGTAKFDLNVAVHERDSGMLIGMEYSTDLFTATTINGLLAAYAELLTAVVADPLQRLTQLPLPGGVQGLAELPESSASGPVLASRPGCHCDAAG